MGYYHYRVLCPYFMWDTEQKIGCENKTKLEFRNKEDAQNYQKKYCADHWKDCTFARMLTEHYEQIYDCVIYPRQED